MSLHQLVAGHPFRYLHRTDMEEEEEVVDLPLVRQHGVSRSSNKQTCVATVSIQSGDSRVVIAVLRVSNGIMLYRLNVLSVLISYIHLILSLYNHK